MKLKDILKEKLLEDLQLVRFRYSGGNDPRPKVKALDFEYPGIEGQKNYGKRSDVLGFNLNYFSNPKQASAEIDRIDTEARASSSSKIEKYEKIRDGYPEVLQFMRRYNKEHIKNLKRKGKFFYRSTNFEELIKKDEESF